MCACLDVVGHMIDHMFLIHQVIQSNACFLCRVTLLY